MNNKRILVTGGAGFIGRYVVAEAKEQGYEVTTFDIANDKTEDTTNYKNLLNATKEKDIVIHLASITVGMEFEKDMKRCYDINVGGIINALNAAKESGCKKFVYASSAYVYPDNSNFAESYEISLQSQKNHYAKSKLINEMIAESYSEKLDVLGLRFFNVYGEGENTKGDYTSIITKFLTKKREGKPLEVYGDGTQARDMINVEDLAKIIFKLIEKDATGIYNIGTGKPLEYRQIAYLIDKQKTIFIKNPLTTYQRYTRADITKLLGKIGKYEFKDAKEWIKGRLK